MPFDVSGGLASVVVRVSAALPHWLVILRFPISSTTGLLAATVDLVHGRPGAPLCFVLRYAAVFVALLNVLGLPLFLVCVFGFVPAWHPILLKETPSNCAGTVPLPNEIQE